MLQFSSSPHTFGFDDHYSAVTKSFYTVRKHYADHCLTVLTFVGTHPEYHGRGAGTMLTEWGLARAKSENIPVYLDSTVPASKMYQKLGFTAVDGLSITLPGIGKDGAPCVYQEVSMLRTWDATK
jgi:GNAT superfamily N-acetyltransferase